MPKDKEFLEEENIEEDLDVYDEEGVEASKENDELSDEEAAFMNGYMNGDSEEEVDED